MDSPTQDNINNIKKQRTGDINTTTEEQGQNNPHIKHREGQFKVTSALYDIFNKNTGAPPKNGRTKREQCISTTK